MTNEGNYSMLPNLIMTDSDWDNLLRRIRDGRCTPFIGSGACYSILPTGGAAAEAWAAKHNYPLENRTNLSRVAQFLAIKTDQLAPKEAFKEDFLKKIAYPNFSMGIDLHSILALLPMPI